MVRPFVGVGRGDALFLIHPDGSCLVRIPTGSLTATDPAWQPTP
jgi:hypothetical protein